MKKGIILAVLAASAILMGAASMYQAGKVKVCHVPYGAPMQTHTLDIPEQGVQAHLDHGDYLGECKYNPNSNNN